MTRRLLVILGASALVLVGTAAAGPAAKPSLAVLDLDPLSIRGTGFQKRERIVVAVTTNDQRVRRAVVATKRGAFVVRLGAIRLDACTGGTLVATGQRSDVVRLKVGLRECPGPVFDP